MRKKLLFTLFLLHILRGLTLAQNIYESIGKQAEVLTLSSGKYQEYFTNDTIMCIGTVLLNTRTKEIVGFFTRNDTSAFAVADVASRWLSIDPLAAKYPDLSPYNFAVNSPIVFIDPDGGDIIISYPGGKYTYGSKDKVPDNQYVRQAIIALDGLINKNADKLRIIEKLKSKDYSASLSAPAVWCEQVGNAGGGSITWEPTAGVVTCDDKRRCSAITLLHELGHTYFQQNFNKVLKVAEDNFRTKYFALSSEERGKIDVTKELEKLENEVYQGIRQELIDANFIKVGQNIDNEDLEDLWIIHNIDNTAADALNNGKRTTHDYKTKFKADTPFSLIGKTAAELGDNSCRQECKADEKAKEKKQGGNN